MVLDHDNIITGKEIEFLKLVLNPSARVAKEIGLVKRLLKEGRPLYKAVRKAGLGWKNYYKYAPLIYDDPEILAPPPKTILKEYKYRNMDVEDIRIVLDGVAKHATAKLMRDILSGKRGKEETRQKIKKNPGKLWLQLCKDLQLKWIYELCSFTLSSE
jgi:hypothetical protein